MRRTFALVLLACGCASAPAPRPSAKVVAPGTIVARLQKDAGAAAAICRTPWVGRFLAAATQLPAVAPRTIYHDADKRRFYTAREAAALAPDARRALVAQIVDEDYYYTARWGSPIAYCRALDLLQLDEVAGRRVLDFGYGSIAQLRLLAAVGADVTGVDVDPSLRVVYGDDAGAFGPGRVRLVEGFFPRDPRVAREVGGGYQLIVSKNTLKNGYVHPVKKNPRYDHGVDDETLARAFFDALAPGGRMLIYNLAPAPNGPGKPYRAWADARTPFARELLERIGFRVVIYDQDDSATARALGHALGWDTDPEEPMDLEHDLYGNFTLLERPQ
jgi:SAM-dependent methyltransferase